MKRFKLISVFRPQSEFSKIGEVFEIEESRLVDVDSKYFMADGLKGLPNPAAAALDYLGPKFIAVFEVA